MKEDQECSRRVEEFDTAVVICTRNRPADLRRCLAASCPVNINRRVYTTGVLARVRHRPRAAVMS